MKNENEADIKEQIKNAEIVVCWNNIPDSHKLTAISFVQRVLLKIAQSEIGRGILSVAFASPLLNFKLIESEGKILGARACQGTHTVTFLMDPPEFFTTLENEDLIDAWSETITHELIHIINDKLLYDKNHRFFTKKSMVTIDNTIDCLKELTQHQPNFTDKETKLIEQYYRPSFLVKSMSFSDGEKLLEKDWDEIDSKQFTEFSDNLEHASTRVYMLKYLFESLNRKDYSKRSLLYFYPKEGYDSAQSFWLDLKAIYKNIKKNKLDVMREEIVANLLSSIHVKLVQYFFPELYTYYIKNLKDALKAIKEKTNIEEEIGIPCNSANGKSFGFLVDNIKQSQRLLLWVNPFHYLENTKNTQSTISKLASFKQLGNNILGLLLIVNLIAWLLGWRGFADDKKNNKFNIKKISNELIDFKKNLFSEYGEDLYCVGFAFYELLRIADNYNNLDNQALFDAVGKDIQTIFINFARLNKDDQKGVVGRLSEEKNFLKCAILIGEMFLQIAKERNINLKDKQNSDSRFFKESKEYCLPEFEKDIPESLRTLQKKVRIDNDCEDIKTLGFTENLVYNK